MTAPRSPLPLRARILAASLPALLAGAKSVAATLSEGAHGRRRAGPGEQFWQFRRYQPGDPANAIDWRQSAKSDPLYVRETEWAAAETVWLWADVSASMRWRSTVALPEKREQALLVAVALAFLLAEAGERVALLGEDATPARDGAGVERLAAAMMANEGGKTLPDPPLARRGRVVLISDFLMSGDDLSAMFRRFAGSGARGHLLQILDPAEESLPYSGRVRFAGLEGEGELLVPNAEDARAAYIRSLTRLRADLAEGARSLGWTFASHVTDASPRQALAALHSAIREG